MAKSTTLDTQLLQLIFNATPTAALFQNGTAPVTSLFVSLHTADPTAAGNQSSSEATYTNYARVGVARTTGGWTVTGNSVSPVAAISFPAGTAGSGTVTNWAVGTLVSGAGQILYTGTVTPNIVTGNGITPILTTGSTVTES